MEDYVLIDEMDGVIKVRHEIDFSNFVLLYHRVLYIATTSTFFRRRIFDENNWINHNFHYTMDLDFIIRLSQRGYRFKHIRDILADYRLHPKSKTCSAPT